MAPPLNDFFPEENAPAAFDVVLRGYDREQVDILMADIQAARDPAPDEAPAAPAVTAEEALRRLAALDVVMRGYDRRQVAQLVERFAAGRPH
ncbi:hypothetical protein CLV63_103294 [Murinocardiopsis flavida]|uniref:DivIVA domain-containing protein n=1 Tax=Murinocardiopsis flavida TaxID=645275 RepID=A0A2P8DQS4_9ACTN|nr:hypothetical protein [Murinocardiopsis flavida]PSK99569.1 hypothetical protein CLV63_103294 [Murinocardiopsis flavida]